MSIFRAAVRVMSASGGALGEGTAYLHLPRGLEREQEGNGTVSLKRWTAAAEPPAALGLEDGRLLEIRVTSDALSDCSRSRILRFSAQWPPGGAFEAQEEPRGG
jgi:hypothetical protein